METGEEQCLCRFFKDDPDMAEDRACQWINDRDLDNQFPESQFVVRVRKQGNLFDYCEE
jgi:hypothetical protein